MLNIIFSIADNLVPLERSYSRLIEQCHEDRNMISTAHMDPHDMIVSVEGNNRWVFYDFEGKNEILLYDTYMGFWHIMNIVIGI